MESKAVRNISAAGYFTEAIHLLVKKAPAGGVFHYATLDDPKVMHAGFFNETGYFEFEEPSVGRFRVEVTPI